MNKSRYHRGWLLYRLWNKFQDEAFATTPEVRTKLGISERVLRRWTADPYFRQAEVAVKDEDSSKLIWNIEKLRLWILVVVPLHVKEEQRWPVLRKSSNPEHAQHPLKKKMPEMDAQRLETPEEAAQILGIPPNYHPVHD